MPRPRFAKISPDKQARILDVATEEFAEHGFEGASYNRIIERAGLSKGAMYYYFDDKTDLYGTVVQAGFRELMDGLAPPEAEDPDAFWEAFRQTWLGVTRTAFARPRLVALTRGLLDHPERWRDGPIAELYQGLLAYTEGLVAAGQAAGAVRQDLDQSLLVSATFALGEALDRWTFEHVEQIRGRDLDEVSRQIVDLYRRLLAPGELR